MAVVAGFAAWRRVLSAGNSLAGHAALSSYLGAGMGWWRCSSEFTAVSADVFGIVEVVVAVEAPPGSFIPSAE